MTRIRQVLINLLGNAIKFTNEGEITLTVSGEKITSDISSDNDYLIKFVIKDTGIGIPIEKQDRLFKAFSQVDSSTTRNYGGTGLGLAISKRLANMMGGDITFTSQSGIGTTFYFAMKTSIPEDMAVNAEKNPLQSQSTLNSEINSDKIESLNILLAEDNIINQKVASLHLKKLGYKADIANNGLEVIELLKSQFYDVIFMDIQMPEMDGLEATRWIRNNLEKQPLIIAMTANAMESDRQMCLEIGMNDYIAKPIDFDLLKKALEKATGKGAKGLSIPFILTF